MSGALAWLVAAVLLFAALLLVHLKLLLNVFRSELPAVWKWSSLFPVVTPIASWKAERRRMVIVWAVLLLSYVLVRSTAG